MPYHLPHGLFSPFLVDRYLNKAQSIPPPPLEYYLFLLYDSEHSDFPVLWKTRHGLKNPPSPWLQSRLTASSVGQIVGLCSAEIKQIVSEYAEKVCGAPGGVLASGHAPRIPSVSLYPSISLMESRCNSPATFIRDMHAMQSRQHLSVSSVNFLLQCLFFYTYKEKACLSEQGSHLINWCPRYSIGIFPSLPGFL